MSSYGALVVNADFYAFITCISRCPRGLTGKRCETTLPTAIVPSKKPACFLKCLNGGTCVIEDYKPKCK